MPPKRKRGDADLDEARKRFRLRGDLKHLRSEADSDLTLTVGKVQIPLHIAFLRSRSRKFNRLLAGHQNLPVDDSGRRQLTIDDHTLRSVRLMTEFIYSDSIVEAIEYPSDKQRIIQDCILLYNLGHKFEIPKMVEYAIKHLGIFLSQKIKDICVLPEVKAKAAVAQKKFRDDLEAGINDAEKAEPGETEFAKKNHPRGMLIDFLVVIGDVLLSDAYFRLDIEMDLLPAPFVRDAFLAIYAGKYHTQWMTNLRPVKATKPETKKRGRCAVCHDGVTKGQTVVCNPWSRQKFTEFCCEDCAPQMDKSDGAGVQWDVFNDVKDE